MMQHVILIDPDGARPQRVTDPDGGIEVRGMHRGGETVGGDVAQADGVGLVLELGNRADRAEDFFLHDLHVFGDVAEDGGLDEVAFFAVALAAGFDFGAFFFAGVDVAAVCVSGWSDLSIQLFKKRR